MITSSRQASDKAEMVSTAAHRMNSTASAAAQGMDQLTVQLAEVASATKQMTATMGEIAGNSDKARQVAGEGSQRRRRSLSK